MCTVYPFIAVSSEAQRVPSAGVPVQRAAMQATGGATAASPEPELPPEPTEEGIYQYSLTFYSLFFFNKHQNC